MISLNSSFAGPAFTGLPRVLNIADLFAGAGGGTDATREACEMAGHESRFTMINHWEVACATARANFPGARVLCTPVESVIAQHLYLRGRLHVLQGGPECIEFSRAAGKKPKNYQYRPTPWCMLRFAEALLPYVVLIENVPEFMKKWPPFRAFVEAFKAIGYDVDWKVFNAANYGDATTRQRMFMLCVRRPLKIVWADPTHSETAGNGLAPWRSAEKHVIDWSRKGRWLDEMPGQRRYGGLPLSPKTFDRIFSGLRAGGCEPVIVTFDNLSNKATTATRSAKKPLSTITSKARHGLAQPYLVKLRGTGKSASLKRPAPTITSGGMHLALIEPALIHTAHGGRRRSRSVKQPLPTIAGNRGDLALIQPFIVPGQGDRRGQRPRIHSVNKPMPTVCASGHAHLVDAAILPQHGGGVMRSVKKPVPTIATDGAVHLVEAFLVKYYGTAKTASLKKPLPTVTTKDRFALCCPVVIRDGKVRRIRIRWRVLEPHELAAAQGFRRDFRFYGARRRNGKVIAIEENANKGDVVKQIGNAWPHHLARALMLAALTQQSDIRPFLRGREMPISN